MSDQTLAPLWGSLHALIWAGFHEYLCLDLVYLPPKHQHLQPACGTVSLLLASMLWDPLSAIRLSFGCLALLRTPF